LELIGHFPEAPPGHPLAVAVCVKEAQDSFRLLERLNDPVQQQSVKTPIAKSNVILVMLVEGVHENLQCGEIPGSLPHARLRGSTVVPRLFWDIKAKPCLVSSGGIRTCR
jgi:hypothetical protein